MRKMLFGVLLLMLVFSLCACGAAEPAAEEATEPAAEEQAAEPAQDNTTEATADAAYVVELLDAQKLTNYEGKEVFTVFYNFTNNSEETTSAMVALYIKAFQDGIQLETSYLSEGDLPEDKAGTYDNDWKDIRPGTTLECYAAFELDSASDVEVEVTEFASFDDEILTSKVYSVQ